MFTSLGGTSRVLSHAPTRSFVAASSAPFTGVGDVVSGAYFYGGLRAYNGAYAAGSGPAIDVVNTADGTGTTTINIKTDGYINAAAVANAISAGGWSGASISKIYDQTGNARHFTNVTLSQMPTWNATGGPNGNPGLFFTAASSQRLTITGVTATNSNGSVAVVSKTTATTGAIRQIFSRGLLGTGAIGIAHRTAADNMSYTASALLAGPLDNVWHAAQGTDTTTGTTKSLYVDSFTPASGAGVAIACNKFAIGASIDSDGAGTIAQFMQGYILETCYWDNIDNTAMIGALNTNMHNAYGGF